MLRVEFCCHFRKAGLFQQTKDISATFLIKLGNQGELPEARRFGIGILKPVGWARTPKRTALREVRSQSLEDGSWANLRTDVVLLMRRDFFFVANSSPRRYILYCSRENSLGGKLQMGSRRAELTKLEWSLMEALWDARLATATDLQRQLESSQGWAYSTVKTMLDRLVEMGYVKARRVGNVYEYAPKVKRPTAIRRVLDDLVDRLCGGSVAPLVQHLLSRGDFDPGDIEKLQSILEKYTD